MQEESAGLGQATTSRAGPPPHMASQSLASRSQPKPTQKERPESILTLLQQHHPSKPIVQIPEIHRADASLIIQLPINIKRLIGLDFHLPHPLAGHDAPRRTTTSFTVAAITTVSAATPLPVAALERRIELVAPWRAVAVAVAVVVAQKIVAPGLLAPLNGQGLVDGGEEVFGQIGCEGDEVVEVLGCVFGVEAAEEVAVGSIGLAWVWFDCARSMVVVLVRDVGDVVTGGLAVGVDLGSLKEGQADCELTERNQRGLRSPS